MKESTKVSIIVPVYNTGRYLMRCVNSLLKQTYKNIEIILINDGSSDNSPDICDKYALAHTNVSVYHTSNLGVSAARNLGIEHAAGDYISFIDSDDYIDNDMIEQMVDGFTSSTMIDIVMCMYYENGEEVKEKSTDPVDHDAAKALVLITEGHAYRGFVWNKLFKRSVINSNKIQFHTDIYMCEDLMFCVDYLKFAKQVHCVNKCLYYYEHSHGNTISDCFNMKRWTAIKAYDYLLQQDIIRSNQDILTKFEHQYVQQCLTLWRMIAFTKKEIKYAGELKKRIKRCDSSFLNNSVFGLKYKLAYLLVKYLL